MEGELDRAGSLSDLRVVDVRFWGGGDDVKTPGARERTED